MTEWVQSLALKVNSVSLGQCYINNQNCFSVLEKHARYCSIAFSALCSTALFRQCHQSKKAKRSETCKREKQNDQEECEAASASLFKSCWRSDMAGKGPVSTAVKHEGWNHNPIVFWKPWPNGLSMFQQLEHHREGWAPNSLTALLLFAHSWLSESILGQADADPVLSIAINLSMIRIILVFLHLGFFFFQTG